MPPGPPSSLAFHQPFDLAETLASGQVFHWDGLGGGGFAGVVGDEPLVVRQMAAGEVVEVVQGDGATAARYLAHDHDLGALRATFPAPGVDPHLDEALAAYPGLRILRQPRWECLATFITSSLKNIPAIRAMSLELRRRFGRRVPAFGREFFAYPTPEAIAAAGEAALRGCGLGYRAPSVAQAAERVAAGEVDLDAIGDLPDDEAREALCGFRGVGEKVANCVLLFAYGRLGAFPIDVWVERVLRERYFPRRRKKLTRRDLQEFAARHFGPNAGYAQQFLFHHARQSARRNGAGLDR